jgi:hypothetical protein
VDLLVISMLRMLYTVEFYFYGANPFVRYLLCMEGGSLISHDNVMNHIFLVDAHDGFIFKNERALPSPQVLGNAIGGFLNTENLHCYLLNVNVVQLPNFLQILFAILICEQSCTLVFFPSLFFLPLFDHIYLMLGA